MTVTPDAVGSRTTAGAALPSARSPSTREPPDAGAIAERAIRVGIGLAALMAGAMTRAIADMLRKEDVPRADKVVDGEPVSPPLVPMLMGASLRLGLDAARMGVQLGSAVGRDCVALVSFAARPAIVRRRVDRARGTVAELDERWRAERARDEELASDLFLRVAPAVVDALLDRLDLTEIALSRLDMDRITDAIDVGRVARRIDVEALVDRVNLDAVAARVDIDTIVRRLDLAGLARDVIDEIDLPRIIRESTGTIADETVEGIRAYGMSADRALSRYVDRVLGRNGSRDDATSSR